MSSKLRIPQKPSDHFITPEKVYEDIIKFWPEFKTKHYFDPCPFHSIFNGLDIPWHKINYVNPPYSLIEEFVSKAIDEACFNKMSIMLLPSKTDRPYFQKLFGKYPIKFLDYRVHFVGEKWHAAQAHFLVRVE